MPIAPRLLPRLRPAVSRLSRPPRVAFITIQSQTPPTPIEPSDKQAHPLGLYYESILNTPQPIPDEKPEEPPASSIPKQAEKEAPATKRKTAGRKPKETTPSAEASQPIPSPPPQTAAEKARIVFGSSLAGPAKRAAELADQRSRSTLVAGILIPPRPEEPDNCCMSGCVNCVWDTYREDMELWSDANARAQMKLRQQRGTGHAVSMDDDGGGSETNWMPQDGKIAKDLWDDSLYRDIPVGIREFMKTEKKLKEQHERDGTLGG